MRAWIVGIGLSVGAFAFAGCGDDTGGSGGGGGESSTSTTSTASGSDCIEVNDTVGGEACGSDTCDPSSYCDQVVCQVGCRTTATCAEGEFCDLTSATDVKAGTCRAPGTNDTICGQSTSATSGTTGGGTSCQSRCYDKLIECGIPEDFNIDPVSDCADVCGRTTQQEQDCIIAADCSALSDGTECGVVLIPSGTGGG